MPNPSSDRAIAIVGVGAILPDAPTRRLSGRTLSISATALLETPANRWSIADYYDPDPAAPDKSYSKIGGWVQGFQFDWKKYRIPPKVAAAMDEGQQWAVTIADEALTDYGYPNRPLDTERTGVILGTAMGGELHYITQNRASSPSTPVNWPRRRSLPRCRLAAREAILQQWHERVSAKLPPITEDTMPGELPNIVSGRVANVLNLRGPNFITDAACASSFAAINAAFEMLTEHHVDAVIAGGVDRNMGAPIFVKFCKIGALSATGSRPFGDGADGFVMGEGSASFLLKRLSDAERDGDKIYAVIRGVGASSDGKGKGITAPNPVGQILAAQRAWENAGLDPATATLVEAHGTSTKVGDVVEVESLTEVFGGAPRHSIGLGSAKGNIGHLKAGAGAAGLLKATMAHPPQGAAAHAQQRAAQSQHRLCQLALLPDPRTATWAQPSGAAPRRRQRLRLRRHQFPPGAGRACARHVARRTQDLRRSHGQWRRRPATINCPTRPANQPTHEQKTTARHLCHRRQHTQRTEEQARRRLPQGGRRLDAADQAARSGRHQAQERLVIDFGNHDELL
jgi:acyl transferase domain-containing protein